MKSPATFRKMAIEIEAMRLATDNLDSIAEWCRGSIRGSRLPPEDRTIDVDTLEGEISAAMGDYIIRDPDGGFCVSHPYDFEKTFAPVRRVQQCIPIGQDI